jgi:hypothetical protein
MYPIFSSIVLSSDLHTPNHQSLSKPPDHWLLIGSHWQCARRVGFLKHLHLQEPWHDIRARWMDVGRLRIPTWDVKCCAVQEACQRATHRRSEVVQLLGVQGELYCIWIWFDAWWTSLSTDTYTSQAHNWPTKGDVPVPEGNTDPTCQHQTPHDHHHVGSHVHRFAQLIIRIEGNNFDTWWRECLMRTGLNDDHGMGDTDEEEEPEDALKWAQRWVETPGQRFRQRLMNDLFNSHFSPVEHRP